MKSELRLKGIPTYEQSEKTDLNSLTPLSQYRLSQASALFHTVTGILEKTHVSESTASSWGTMIDHYYNPLDHYV